MSRVQGLRELGFGAEDVNFRVWGPGLGIYGLGYEPQELGLKGSDSTVCHGFFAFGDLEDPPRNMCGF